MASRDVFDTMVVTSPNMDYVPCYPVQTTLVHTYADGLWGPFEYSRFPQTLVRGMWHVACIPALPRAPILPEELWLSLSNSKHWLEDDSIGFGGLGYIVADVQAGLVSASTIAIRRFEEYNSPSNVQHYGRMLVMILRQVVDRMRCLPAAPNVAIAVAAHVQRVCLELAGLRTYAEVVVPRLESSLDYAEEILPVVGAFAREGSEAQNLTRVGIPTWFLQPLTHELPVWRIVHSRPWTTAVSTQEMNPPVFQRTSSLVGIANLTGNWQQSMLMTISKHVAGTHLALLSLAEVPEVPWEEPPFKRAKVDEREGTGLHLGMHASRSDPPIAEPTKTRRGRRRGKGKLHEADAECVRPGVHPTSASLQSPLEQSHPSKTFTPSPWYDVVPVWKHALQDVSPIPRTPSSALYFYPPPFLLDTVSSIAGLPSSSPYPERARPDEKVHRYLHNLVRIRRFLRARMFDPSLAHEPLTISEWRVALWGDYSMKTHMPRSSGSASDLRRAQRRQGERNGVSRLFSRIAQLRSYQGNECVKWHGSRVNLEAVSTDPSWRLKLLWESHEINFRAEVIALDTLLVHKPTWLEVHRWEREALVSGIWGPPSSTITVIPDEVSGVTEFRWMSCDDNDTVDQLSLMTLQHFVKVLIRWPDCPEEVAQAGMDSHIDSAVFNHLQAVAVDFYVRTFVRHYSRLPVPPIILHM